MKSHIISLRNTGRQIVITESGNYKFEEDLKIFCDDDDFQASIIVRANCVHIDFDGHALYGSVFGIYVSNGSDNFKMSGARILAKNHSCYFDRIGNIKIFGNPLINKYSDKCFWRKGSDAVDFSVGKMNTHHKFPFSKIVKKIMLLCYIFKDVIFVEDLFFVVGKFYLESLHIVSHECPKIKI